jgi:hypothetical protein
MQIPRAFSPRGGGCGQLGMTIVEKIGCGMAEGRALMRIVLRIIDSLKTALASPLTASLRDAA